ncbi:MAG: DUF6067 family protein [Chitinophagaceae bacterium]
MRKLVVFLISIFISVFCLSQSINYTSGNNAWNSDSLGNHRAVVTFNGTGSVAKAIIEWRRKDDSTEKKRIIIQDAKTLLKIENVKTGKLNNEIGEIYFEPASGKGDYYVYYMPYKNEGRSNYPKGVYLRPEMTANDSWLKSVNETMAPNTITKEIQSIDSFNSFYPMEVIATANETATLITKSKQKDFIVFPEDRLYPIKMTDHLPLRWIQKGITNSFKGEAAKGEYYALQLGIYALQPLEDVSVSFTDLKDKNNNRIASKNISCINTTGIDYKGMPLAKTVNIGKDSIQPLWCGIDVPQSCNAGTYTGKAIIKCRNANAASISITLIVNNKTVTDGGISEPEKQTRLKWLNSTLYQDNTVIKPYIPLQLQDNNISLLGRKLKLGGDGLPEQVQTFFTPEMTDYKTEANNILTAPIHFLIKSNDGQIIKCQPEGIQYLHQTPGTIQWTAVNKSAELQMKINGAIEFDGFIAYTVRIIALKDISLKDIALQIPFTKEAARYMMGLGQKGGYRPASFEWKWDVAYKNQDGAWIGNVNAGLQYSLHDENYSRPLNTNFYLQKPLLLPSSWGNNNKGGVNIIENENSIIVNNYSGERLMKKGDSLFYNFNLLITPFHPINTDFQWQTRFYHKYDSIDKIKSTGATVINIHHATPINPWINYPFIEFKKMKRYIDEAHSKGLKVKIYNTVREVSNRAYETFALRSLGHEVYSTGKGGGFSWLQEHVHNDYIAAWFVPEIKDAALVNSGMSRWHNYYVEGMNWLVQNVGIDGIYLDDVAFDRVTMKRIKRALTQDNHPGIIDLHSANQYNRNDGFNNSANLYMEHFPYLNRLWFGEYFDYNNNPADFFLTEVSGIPFGLMGEMLQDGGNPWRGMVFGMTNRMPWSDDADPRPIWKVWDDFGMQGTKMIGYWSDNCPVKTSNDKILATVYKKEKIALVSIASWADTTATIQLNIDWSKLGIDSSKATIIAPGIKNFQLAATFKAGENISIEKGKGLLLIIKEN